MAHTEFYVAATGNDLYGGSSESLIWNGTCTAADSGLDSTITDDGAAGTLGAAVTVGDWLIFDAGGVPAHTQVKSISDPDTIIVHPAAGGTLPLRSVANGNSVGRPRPGGLGPGRRFDGHRGNLFPSGQGEGCTTRWNQRVCLRIL